MKKIFIILIIIFVLAGTGIFYLLRPRTLGVSFTAQDLTSFKNKINVTYQSLPTDTPLGRALIASGSHPVDQSFSSEEISAAADNRSEVYAYFPFHNIQIRVNNDGSVEGSATVNYKDAVNYLMSLGASSEDISKAAQKFKIPNADLPVYLKVSGEVENNVSRIDVLDAKIANIGVPQGLMDEYGPGLNELVEEVIKDRQPSYNIQKLEVVDGKVRFKGSSPDIEQAVGSM